MAQPAVEPLEAGREALERHAWDEAYDILVEADRRDVLPAEGLKLLADAAWWSAHPDEAVSVLERAYQAYLREGDRSEAAMMAFRLAEQHGMRMAIPQAGGWAAKAERLGAEDPEAPVHGHLAWMRGMVTSIVQHDLEAAMALYDQALEFAARTGDASLHAKALHDKGHTLCMVGRLEEGLAMMDEAMTSVVGGELEPDAAGYIYCGMIGACTRLSDWARAAEWTEATTRWCERHSITAFPGVCRVHRAQLMRLRGSWSRAEEEALTACEELPRFNLLAGVGYASYEIGEVRRQRGDLAGAKEAFDRAHQYGHTCQPGLSLLLLAQGKTEAAAASIRQALTDQADDRLGRVQLLAAQAQIALAADDVETAAAAADRLEAIVEPHSATAVRATSACVRGAVHLAQGDLQEALADLNRARQGWQELEAPYELAEVHLLLARAQRRLGDEESAALEARTARHGFERLGARLAAAKAGQLLGELTAGAGRPERVRRAFVFTDIVKSTDLVGIIGDEAWDDLLTWHDQTLRSLFAAHGGDVAHHTGDGFFVAFADTRSALACSVAVQRALAEHRRAHGFSPLVRIGVHASEATRRGDDYGGGEVHKAARIAALAEGGEIVASDETLAEADGGFEVTNRRQVALKGISEPVSVASVRWR